MSMTRMIRRFLSESVENAGLQESIMMGCVIDVKQLCILLARIIWMATGGASCPSRASLTINQNDV